MRRMLLALVFALATDTRAQTTFTELESGIPADVFDQEGEFDEYFVSSVAAADVDGDGDLDLRVLATYVDYDTFEERTYLTLYRNDGPDGNNAWVFTPSSIELETEGEGTGEGDLAWGDYDTDGDVDLVVAYSEATTLYRNDGGALVPTAVPLPLYREENLFSTGALSLDRRSITWADSDNDGDVDLLMPSVYDGQTVLLENQGPGGPGGWTFTPAASTLPETFDAQTAWGDYDNDGDLDLLIQENETFQGGLGDSYGYLRIVRNDAGTFVPSGPSLVASMRGTVEWTDYDADGDLDLLVAGSVSDDLDSPPADVVRVYRNDGAAHTLVPVLDAATDPEWWYFDGAAWADYDNDGDVDLLVTGDNGPGGANAFSVVYVNDGGTFTRTDVQLASPGGDSGGLSSPVWFDLDNDGDLDYFVAGYGYNAFMPHWVSAFHLYRNDATTSNTPPAAPSILDATVVGDDVTFTWSPAADDHTAVASLTYNLWVRRPGSDIVSPHARTGGTRLVAEPGNVSYNTGWTLHDLEPGTYTWTVQAIDNAFNGGAFAAESTFTVSTVGGEDEPRLGSHVLSVTPSPAQGQATVGFTLDRAQTVEVAVYDALGRRAAVLHNGPLAAGTHGLALDASALPPGVYVVRATGEVFHAVRQTTIVR